MIRVLVVDDSATMRTVISGILETDPELKVAGQARNGKEAIALCQELKPDIITMDIRMPEMDGYQAIQHIMSEFPRPIVVLTTSQSDRELGTSFKAVEYGALMVLGKPSGLTADYRAMEDLRAQVKAMAGVKVVGRRRRPEERPDMPEPMGKRTYSESGPITLIAIGASTGGPPALQMVLGKLPRRPPVPVVVVQHISEGFVNGLARWLKETTRLEVTVAENAMILKPGIVYIAPDNRHLAVGPEGRAWLKELPPVDGHRPSVTTLFESVAVHYGKKGAGVLLTGMGADGAAGLKRIRDAGGYTIAQDEETSVIFGMPREAIKLGGAVEVAPLEEIAPLLIRRLDSQDLRTAK